MKPLLLAIAASAVAFSLSSAAPQSGRLCEPWQVPYTGTDATGDHVIGFWPFSPGQEPKDASGHGHDLQWKGAVPVPDARFGGCLESFCGHPVEDARHAAVAARHPSLSPEGPFTLELWIKPKAEFAEYPDAFLVDKKYVADTDYQLVLGAPNKQGQRRLSMRLGFGTDSEIYVSEARIYPADEWHHLAFTYDGNGDGRFYCDGSVLGGESKPGRGSIVPGAHPLSLGDRIGSLYHGFPGSIAQVRLCRGVLEFRSASFALVSDRDVYLRMEKAPALRFEVTNLQRSKVEGGEIAFALEGGAEKAVALPVLEGGAKWETRYVLDTALRPAVYTLAARVRIPGEHPYSSEERFPLTIVPRPLPHRMPVVMWGVYGAGQVIKEMPRLKDLGFTHCLGFGADYGLIFEAGKPVEPAKPEEAAEVKRMLNLALANDFRVTASLSPGRWAESRKEFLRIGRDGKAYEQRPSICGLFPELQKLCYDTGASVAGAYSAFPAWDSALLHTELRDAANLCFHAHDGEACRKATGSDVPPQVAGKWGVEYGKLPDFPKDRVIPDEDPVYQYLRWYWREGDGWNGLNSELHRGLKSGGRADLWTFHDPAVRVASVFGSGGAVDVISQWTYSYPDPIRIGVATDELFAMAKGAGHPQRVMKMTQIIWYRSQTAPMQKGDEQLKAPKSPWEDTDPDAAFPTIAPMHLREAFWTKMARPVQGIMYHGWQSLVPSMGAAEGSYRYTHPQTQHELRRLVREVVEPLGPALMQVPDRRSDVAYLESFASQMFARRGTYGWGHGWSGDAYQMLMWAQLQPEIVFEETVVKHGLEGFRVLVLMDCDVLTASVVKKVQEFQAKGGIIVGDDRLCPAIRADILVERYERKRQPDADRTALLERAAKLRQALDTHYLHYSDSANPEVVTRCRTCGSTDYLFGINDRREFGHYVGQYRLVMEDGLPSATTLSLARSRGHVYDLVEGAEIPCRTEEGRLRIPADFAPCQGKVLMVTQEAIAQVTIELPGEARLGSPVAVKVAVRDGGGRPVDAIVPLRLDVRDPSGAQAERSGFYGAKDGHLEVQLDLAPNDSPGLWEIEARELASRRSARGYLRVGAP